MKKWITVAMSVATLTCHADYVPGRVRTNAMAKMEVTEATGSYKGLQTVRLESLVSDDKGLLGYRLTLLDPGSKRVSYHLVQSKGSSCGDTYLARTSSKETIRSQLLLKNMANAKCEIFIGHLWIAKIITKSPKGITSRLNLQGNPEFPNLTQKKE